MAHVSILASGNIVIYCMYCYIIVRNIEEILRAQKEGVRRVPVEPKLEVVSEAGGQTRTEFEVELASSTGALQTLDSGHAHGNEQ